jgi:hypothetical protein
MFQKLSNDIRNFLIQLVLTPAIALWSPSWLQLPKWELTWECGGSFPHTLPHSGEHEMWLLASVLAQNFVSPSLGREPKARVVTTWVCDQVCFIQTFSHKSLDNFVLYEPMLLHLCLVHVVLCHSCSELSHQPINVMSFEAFCIKR